MDNKNNKSPLRYPGGKTRACKVLDNILKENFNLKDFTLLVSPFLGGGSFEFYIQNKYHLNILANDKFKPLYNFWNTCKIDKVNLCNELKKKIDLIDKKKVKDIVNSFSKNTKSEVITMSTLERKTISKIKAKLISYAS